jgi:hypothetical protein
MLTLTRELIALRHGSPDLRSGSYRSLEATPGTWAWRRGDGTVVVANMTEGSGVVEPVSGTVRLATRRARTGSSVTGTLTLEGWEAVVVALGGDEPA